MKFVHHSTDVDFREFMRRDVLNSEIHQPPGISKGKRSPIRGGLAEIRDAVEDGRRRCSGLKWDRELLRM